MTYDVIVAGGSYAGLSAALQLVRARRRVLVIDAGQRRNRFASSSHGFLGQDGRAPGDIVADARAQLMEYPTAEWSVASIDDVRKTDRGFSVRTSKGDAHDARRLILATGVIDTLPDVPGLSERWGRSVFHCPYCHGYELGTGAIGVLGVSPLSMHHAMMLPDWGTTTFFTNGAFTPDSTQLKDLHRRGVVIENTQIAEIIGERADIVLLDGQVIAIAGLFTLTRTSMASGLAAQLGCAFEDGPLGPFIQTDVMKETTVAGVYACGDAARAAGSVAMAVGDGAMAGVGVHQSLIMRDT